MHTLLKGTGEQQWLQNCIRRLCGLSLFSAFATFLLLSHVNTASFYSILLELLYHKNSTKKHRKSLNLQWADCWIPCWFWECATACNFRDAPKGFLPVASPVCGQHWEKNTCWVVVFSKGRKCIKQCMRSWKACVQGEMPYPSTEIGERGVFIDSILPVKHSSHINPHSL